MKIAELTAALNRYRAVNPRFAPDFTNPDVVSFWFEAVGHYPIATLASAMNKLVRGDHFPSINEVERELGVIGANPVDDGSVISGKIVEAITRFGWSGPDEAKAFVGSLGWEVVKLSGGWAQVCNVTNDDLGTHKAQWRDLARSILNRGGKPLPELPPPMSNAALKLVSGFFEGKGKGQQ